MRKRAQQRLSWIPVAPRPDIADVTTHAWERARKGLWSAQGQEHSARVS